MAPVEQFRGAVPLPTSPRIIGVSNYFAAIRVNSLPLKSTTAITRRCACLSGLETLSNGADEGGLSMRFEHWWYAVPLRVRSFFRRNRVEQELEEEFRFHLDQLIAQELAAGRPADEAKRVALLAMDGMERQKERCRDMRRVPYIEALVHDFHHGLRALQRKPMFSPDFLRLRARTDLFDNAVAYVRDDVTVTGIDEPAQAIVSRTSAGLFTTLGAHARLGRALVEADDDPGAANVAVLSDRFWRLVFRGDPNVLGRVILLSDEPYTVAGVMPPDFEFAYSNMDLWVPIRLRPGSTRGWLEVVARMRAGISIWHVRNAMEVAAHQFEREDPKEKAGLRIKVSPWQETPTREYELT